MTFVKVPGSGAPSIVILMFTPNSMEIAARDNDGGGVRGGSAPSGAIASGTKASNSPRGRAISDSSRRYRYKRPRSIPASRATSDALTPGSINAETNRSFSARENRRRRSTDVMTSI
jgi:hypothetical protein